MEQAEQIIAAVQERDILWNPKNINYKNVKAKANEWQALADELNLPVAFVKKRWRGLRDNYTRKLSKRKVACQGANDLEPIPMGKYSAQLEFLKNHLKPKATNKYFIESTEEGSPGELSAPDLDCSPFGVRFVNVVGTGPNAPTTSVGGSSTSMSDPFPPSLSSPAKRRNVVTKPSAIEHMCLSTTTSSQEFISGSPAASAIGQMQSPAPSNLEDEFFCRSLVGKLSTLPIEIRNSTKVEIMRYINYVQMECMRPQQS